MTVPGAGWPPAIGVLFQAGSGVLEHADSASAAAMTVRLVQPGTARWVDGDTASGFIIVVVRDESRPS
ncbi:hypothetical protein [Comamonas sp. JC664]|uniref:hypothetical protein n=1 Tax=Comamonas sp. JC664 TaxID=2801917 RepID=UPI00366FF33A